MTKDTAKKETQTTKIVWNQVRADLIFISFPCFCDSVLLGSSSFYGSFNTTFGAGLPVSL